MRRCTQCFGDLHELAIFCPQCGQPHEPEFDRLLNQSVGGRYFIYRRLGEGGMSTVFAAIDQTDDRVVALKVTDPRNMVNRQLTYAFDAAAARRYWDEMTERMRREAEALAEVEHRNIVRIRDTGMVHDDLRYVAMEFLRGRTLREEIAGRIRLPFGEALTLALEVATGLSEIHAREIIHRDLNPRNIFLCEGGEVKVIDFGIAKLPQPPGAPPFTQFSIMRGTVAYSSPEQCQSRPLDHRSDIYSLGVVLYEMVTGARPFNGRTPTEIALKQIQEAPAPPRALVPDLPPSLETALLRALAKDPAERQQSIGELIGELRAIAGRLVIPVATTPRPVELIPPLRDFGEDWGPTEGEGELSPEPTSADRSRLPRRATLAATALVLAFVAGALLLGRSLLFPARHAAPAVETAAATPSPLSETPTASPVATTEADALEIAARLSTPSPPVPLGAMIYSVPTPSRVRTSPVARPIPIVREKSPRPANSRPSLPQAAPTFSVPTSSSARGSQPASRPESTPEQTQSPAPPASGLPAATARNEAEHSTAREPEREAAPMGRPESRDPAPRDVQADSQTEAPEDERPAREIYAPKLIMWSGYVDRERTVTLELPGVPGSVEIPRSYSKRIGVVEPPNFDNGWRKVILRVYGRGEVSVVIRWWPRQSQVANAHPR